MVCVTLPGNCATDDIIEQIKESSGESKPDLPMRYF
jgi:hypothetical protein